MKSGIVSLVLIVVLVGCSGNSDTSSKEKLAARDSAARSALVLILGWHRMNDSTLSRLQNEIVVYQFIGSDSTISYQDLQKSDLWEDTVYMKKLYYRVSKPNLERYLAFVKASGFFTENFVENLRQHALQSDSQMVAQPMNDGPPFGFAASWLASSQAPIVFIERPDTIPWSIKQSSDSTVQLSWDYVNYELVLRKERWLINNQ